MKNLIQLAPVFFTFIVFNNPALAQAQEPVEILDQGACWIQQIKPDGIFAGYKIASFGAGTSLGAYTDEFSPEGSRIKEWVREQIKGRFPEMPAMKYEIGLHCSSSGYFLSIQVNRAGQPICLQAKASGPGMNEFTLVSMNPDASFTEGSVCYGIEERTLGLSLVNSHPETIEALRALIVADPALSSMIETVEYSTGALFAMAKLKPEFSYHEVESKRTLEGHGLFRTLVRNIWLNGYNAIVGEDRTLFQGTVDAYAPAPTPVPVPPQTPTPTPAPNF